MIHFEQRFSLVWNYVFTTVSFFACHGVGRCYPQITPRSIFAIFAVLMAIFAILVLKGTEMTDRRWGHGPQVGQAAISRFGGHLCGIEVAGVRMAAQLGAEFLDDGHRFDAAPLAGRRDVLHQVIAHVETSGP